MSAESGDPGARGRATLIVALDVPGEAEARALVDELGQSVSYYKVGLQLFSAVGPGLVRALSSQGKSVFLDLKLHDIPNTVARAVAAAADTGAELLTVHASGGRAMLEAAVRAAEEARRGQGRAPLLLGVTLLTSHSAEEVASLWGRPVGSLENEVARLAGIALEAGLDGVVASALEASALRARFGQRPLIVTPGIRLATDSAHDQARVATPAAAARAGADYLVVGRSVTAAPDPGAAVAAILRDLE